MYNIISLVQVVLLVVPDLRVRARVKDVWGGVQRKHLGQGCAIHCKHAVEVAVVGSSGLL